MDVDAIKDETFFKEFSPFMMLKWYAAVKDPKRILLVNHIVNPMLFELHADKALLYKLFCCCSDGSSKQYSWIKRPKKVNVDVLRMIGEYYDISGREAEFAFKELSKEDLLEILDHMGYDEKLRGKIKKNI